LRERRGAFNCGEKRQRGDRKLLPPGERKNPAAAGWALSAGGFLAPQKPGAGWHRGPGGLAAQGRRGFPGALPRKALRDAARK